MNIFRFFVLFLSACVPFSLLAGCNGPSGRSEPTTGPQQTTEATLPPLEGTMELNTAADLQAMAGNPVKTYILKHDIDMGGAEWTGIAGFRGVFEGNGHTISNLTIVAAEGSSDLGFFADITAEGEVKDLNLANVTIDASATSAKNIGTVAGTVLGKVTNCTATGIISDTRETEMNVGALAGTAAAGAVVEGGTTISVTDDAGVYTTEGLAADVKLFVADHENMKRGLVGTAAGAAVTGLWRDSFYSSERNSDALKERQDKAVDYMYTMGAVKWTVPETVVFNSDSKLHVQTFEPGTVYTGVPYTHTYCSMESFMDCLDENNQLDSWAMEEFGDADTNIQDGGFATRMGNDCAGALDWAWLAISPIDVFQGGAAPKSTHYLIPSPSVQKQYGIYPVGQMTGDTFDGEDAAYEVVSKTDSQEFVNLNGDTVIYEAYAMSRKADVVVYRTTAGHVRMLAVDPMVIRNADGAIDAVKSYMITHEQGDGLFERRNQGGNSSWRLYYRYAFEILLHGSSKEVAAERTAEAGSGVAYIPITIRALREENVLVPAINVYPAAGNSEITSPESGSFSSAYRITYTHMVIKDESGDVVFEERCHNSNSTGDKKITLALQYDGVTKDLAPGQYTFTVTAMLSDGSEHMVVEDLAFGKK